MEYIEFEIGCQAEFLKKAKNSLGFSWKKFAELLNVNRSMIFFYLNEKCRLPKNKYEMICSILGKVPEKYPIILIQNKPQPFRLPKICKELAEFVGMIVGDGHISPIIYEINISLDRISDARYVVYGKSIFEKLFGLKPKIYSVRGVSICKIYSRGICEYLTNTFNLPYGRKMNKSHIPSIFLNDSMLLAAFLRGFFDTDGSFHRHRARDAAVEFISRDAPLLD